jgi:hypothetical protein
MSDEVAALINTADVAEQGGNAPARIEAATAAMAAMKAAMTPTPPATPSNAIEAGQRRDHLMGRADFRNAVMAGDRAALKEFNELNEKIVAADPISLAIGGVVPVDGVDENGGAVAGGRELVEGAAHLRDLGLPDVSIDVVLRGGLIKDNGTAFTAEETATRVAEVERGKASLMRDPTWRRAYLDGERAAAEEMLRINAILVAAGKGGG